MPKSIRQIIFLLPKTKAAASISSLKKLKWYTSGYEGKSVFSISLILYTFLSKELECIYTKDMLILTPVKKKILHLLKKSSKI